MPRKRKDHKDLWLPSRVYRGKSAYEFHPKGGGAIKLVELVKDHAGNIIENDQIKHAVITAKIQAEADMVSREDMSWLIDMHFGSVQFKELSETTKKNDLIKINRVKKVFGRMLPHDVTSGHIRMYMDEVGEKSKSSANRDHGLLSRIFNWAKERNLVRENPVHGVKKFSEKPRDRYVEDWEYWLVYEASLQSSYPWVAPQMEIAYLCRMRSNEVRGILIDKHLQEDGIFVQRGKGSKNEITAWSDRLRKAVTDADLLSPDAPQRIKDRPLFYNKTGGPVSDSSFKSAWRRIRTTAMEIGVEIDGRMIKLKESFNFHDLKAKGITDHETKSGGHRSKKMEAVYDRKPEIIKATR